MNTKQTQIRLGSQLKDAFKEACKQRQSSMTGVLVMLIRGYITDSLKNQGTLKSLADLESQYRSGLVRDERGVWRTREELLKPSNEDDWSF